MKGKTQTFWIIVKWYTKFFNNLTTNLGLGLLDFLYECIRGGGEYEQDEHGPIQLNQECMINQSITQYVKDLLNDLTDETWYVRYIESFYWALATFLLIGSKGYTFYESFYCVIVLLVSLCAFAYIL